MNVPKELMYTKSHEWVKTVDDTTVTVGLTDYAQDALGDLVFVNLLNFCHLLYSEHLSHILITTL